MLAEFLFGVAASIVAAGIVAAGRGAWLRLRRRQVTALGPQSPPQLAEMNVSAQADEIGQLATNGAKQLLALALQQELRQRGADLAQRPNGTPRAVESSADTPGTRGALPP